MKRIQSRWPQELFTNDIEKAKAMLLDLVERNVERLEAKLEVHTDREGEYLLRRAARQGFDDSPRGERLRRYEMACDRRFYRSLAAFWKHRREMERAQEGEELRFGGIRRGCGWRNGRCSSTYRAAKTKM